MTDIIVRRERCFADAVVVRFHFVSRGAFCWAMVCSNIYFFIVLRVPPIAPGTRTQRMRPDHVCEDCVFQVMFFSRLGCSFSRCLFWPMFCSSSQSFAAIGVVSAPPFVFAFATPRGRDICVPVVALFDFGLRFFGLFDAFSLFIRV